MLLQHMGLQEWLNKQKRLQTLSLCVISRRKYVSGKDQFYIFGHGTRRRHMAPLSGWDYQERALTKGNACGATVTEG